MSEKNKFHRNIMKTTRGVNANGALAKAIKEKNAFRCGEDSIKRTEIHGIIINGVQEGKTKEEIISILSVDRYEKYSMYFENWIQDAIRKNQIQKEKEEKQKEEK